jgi:hypothetical protein
MEPSGGEDKNSQPIPGLEPLIMQSVAQRYTSYKTVILGFVLHEL